MTTLNLGRVRPVWKGDWVSTATYLAFDFVRYTDGNVYLAVQDVPANYIPSSQTSYWVLFGAKGDTGSAGSVGATGSQGPAGPTGPAGTTNYNNLTNKPVSDTSLKLAGGFADAKATGEALDKRVGVASQSFSDNEKEIARANIGWAAAFAASFASAIAAWVTSTLGSKIEAYLVPILKQLCLDNGATQAEIDALENESDS